MKISGDPKSPHYFSYAQGGPGVAIKIDGREVTHVIEADDEAGYVIRHRTFPTGELVVGGGEFATERLEGEVEILLGHDPGSKKRRLAPNLDIPQVERFLADLHAVCVRHGMVLDYEDTYGGQIVFLPYEEDPDLERYFSNVRVDDAVAAKFSNKEDPK